ncbi:FTP domain-containing protein [Trichonephila clavata]|uniref:FTP domain-containing protein n=1 Tax=Trichonephila clavata TaxID=2740835 RepID=A0A8X6H0M1_TRICU|nr:FTP domain-containing protein [Trichonephila clavata]
MEKWKNGLMSVILLVMCFQYTVARDPTPKTYIRTSGKREKGLGIHRIPERMEVATCLGRCQQTPSCICMRIATTGTGICETFTNTSNPNILKTTGFVYYAADMYKKTLETHSLALAKPSYQSSTYRLKNVKYTADRANDGNRNVEGFLQPYFAHTMDGPDSEPYPWWQVDLEDEYVITGIFILNRRNWAFRLHDIQVRVGNVKLSKKWDNEIFEENSLCGEHVGGGIGDAVVKKFICLPCPLHGRYISVQIIKFCDDCPENDANVLQLAEVDVYGYKHIP